MSALIIIHNREEASYYKTINLTTLLDKRLSWKAKGIHVYIRTRPQDWKIWVKDLENRSIDKRCSVYSGLKELIEKRYLYRGSIRDSRKRITQGIYISFDKPTRVSKELLEKLVTENQHLGFPRYSIIRKVSKKRKKKGRERETGVSPPKYVRNRTAFGEMFLNNPPPVYDEPTEVRKMITALSEIESKCDYCNWAPRDFKKWKIDKKHPYYIALSKTITYLFMLRGDHINSMESVYRRYIESIYERIARTGNKPQPNQFTPSPKATRFFEEEYLPRWTEDYYGPGESFWEESELEADGEDELDVEDGDSSGDWKEDWGR